VEGEKKQRGAKRQLVTGKRTNGLSSTGGRDQASSIEVAKRGGRELPYLAHDVLGRRGPVIEDESVAGLPILPQN
jgi:hypothetical protein